MVLEFTPVSSANTPVMAISSSPFLLDFLLSVWQAEALLKIASRWWDKGPVQLSSTAKSVVFIFSVSVPVPCLPANIYIYFFFWGGEFYFLKANMVVTEPIKTTKKSFAMAFLLKKLLDRYLQKEPINIYIIF